MALGVAWGSYVLRGDVVEHGAAQATLIVQGGVFCALAPFALVVRRGSSSR